MLTNLAPASQDVIARGDSFTAALGSFASLLWLFNIDRTTGTASSVTGGRLVLHDVVLVLPAYELQLLRMLMSAPSPNQIVERPLASMLLWIRLQSNLVGCARAEWLLVLNKVHKLAC